MSAPPCWTICRTRREQWDINRDSTPRRCWGITRDVFGFEVVDREWVFVLSFQKRRWALLKKRRWALDKQQVDYSHGQHFGADTCVQLCDEEETTYSLHDVISVTSIKHFAHLWQRNAKTLKKRRQLFLLLDRARILNSRVSAIICNMVS